MAPRGEYVVSTKQGTKAEVSHNAERTVSPMSPSIIRVRYLVFHLHNAQQQKLHTSQSRVNNTPSGTLFKLAPLPALIRRFLFTPAKNSGMESVQSFWCHAVIVAVHARASFGPFGVQRLGPR